MLCRTCEPAAVPARPCGRSAPHGRATSPRLRMHPVTRHCHAGAGCVTRLILMIIMADLLASVLEYPVPIMDRSYEAGLNYLITIKMPIRDILSRRRAVGRHRIPA